MTVGEAKALAREWVLERARELPDVAGACLYGSICLRKDEDELPCTSDADVFVAMHGNGHDPFIEVDGEFRVRAILYKGLDIETRYPSINDFHNQEAALADSSLAVAFRSRNVLLDPTGALARLHERVSARYAQEKWVRARCANLEKGVRGALNGPASASFPLPGWADEVLRRTVAFYDFGLATAACIPCVADLGGVTFRRALQNSRAVLETHRMPDLYGKLLEILGGAGVTEPRAFELLEEAERAFDLAVRYIRTRFCGDWNFETFLRSKVLACVRELVAGGAHREVLPYLLFIRTTAQNVFENDAPPPLKEEMRKGHRRLLSTLGIDSAADIDRKAEKLENLLPEIMAAAETIMARNPAVERE